MAEGAADRLYERVASWHARDDEPAVVIDAACQALIDGLDSQSLRELAGASPRDRAVDIRDLVVGSLEELGIPFPWDFDGGISRRGTLRDLRLEVVPVTEPEAGGGFHVLVYVDGTEKTASAAGLGMDPYDLLVPTNQLIATDEPHTVPIARCTCGEYDCGGTDVTIVRDGEKVHWTWLCDPPVDHGVSFVAAAYDAEMARVAADHSWETPDRTAGRLILTHLDREKLASHGYSVMWVGNAHDDPGTFRVSLMRRDKQVFVDFPWRGRDPQELANKVCETLRKRRLHWPWR